MHDDRIADIEKHGADKGVKVYFDYDVFFFLSIQVSF